MGAREDVLDAARTLRRNGVDPFSARQMVEVAEDAGTAYPESTLRTMTHHMTKAGDLVRVSRGRFSLTDADDGGPAGPSDAREAASAEPTGRAHWTWPGNVQMAVVRHLSSEGWRIREVTSIGDRETDADIEASHRNRRLLVKVRGYPPLIYTRGASRGQPNRAHTSQARQYFIRARRSANRIRAGNPDAEIVIAVPDFPAYEQLHVRSIRGLRKARIDVWLVSEAGDVRKLTYEA